MRYWPSLLLLPPLLLLLLWQWVGTSLTRPAELVGSAQLSGFEPAETSPYGSFRWSGPQARLNLPAGSLPGTLTLYGAVAPATTLDLRLGDAPPVRLAAIGEVPKLRRYQLLLPPTADALGRVDLQLVVTAPTQVGERVLGLALHELSIRPVASGLRLPPSFVWLAVGGLPLLLTLSLILIGQPPQTAGMVATLMGLGLATVAARYPDAVDPLFQDLYTFASPLVGGWWLAIQLLGIAALPLTLLALPRLPLGGYPLAKSVGLLLTTLLVWITSLSGLAPFGLASVVAAVVVIALVSLATYVLVGRRKLIQLWPGWRAILGWELLFLAGLYVGCWLRWHGATGPALTGTEKPMELMLLNAVLRYDQFPPLDPWFAGYELNYYYLGYVAIGVITLLTATPVASAFNLGFALIVALTVVGVAYIATALAALTPQGATGSRGGRRALAGLALLFTLLVGNQAGALQLIVATPQWRALEPDQLVEAVAQRLRGAEEIRLSRPVAAGWDGQASSLLPVAKEITFDWFLPSRMIYDDLPLPEGGVERRYAITEFPAFSLYLGDLHPHVLVVPVHLLTLALALSLIVTGPSLARAALAGVSVGAIYTINSWDAPTYALLCAGALILGARRTTGIDWRQLLLSLASAGAAAILTALPFIWTFTPPAGAVGASPLLHLPLIGRIVATFGLAESRTQLHSFLFIFGLFLLPILLFAAQRGTAKGWPTHQRLLIWSLVISLVVGQFVAFPLLFLFPLAALLVARAWQEQDPAPALAHWLAAVGALALLAPELVYIRDHLEGLMSRMVTIFKFYYHSWFLWGIAAAYALWRLIRTFRPSLASFAWLLPTIALTLGAAIYPLGLLRWAEPWAPSERTFDGLAFLAREAPDELAAARWLQANVRPEERVLTGFCNCDYERIARPASISGVQTLLGILDGHERVWRSGIPEQMAVMELRERDIPAMYTATDPEAALSLLRTHQIRYIYVGPRERELHGEAGERLFAERFPLVFAQGEFRIYQVPP